MIIHSLFGNHMLFATTEVLEKMYYWIPKEFVCHPDVTDYFYYNRKSW